jgi:hypothetical protein
MSDLTEIAKHFMLPPAAHAFGDHIDDVEADIVTRAIIFLAHISDACDEIFHWIRRSAIGSKEIF